MAVGSKEPEFDKRRWGELVTLLSMDVVRPFYDLMGLRLIEADALQRIMRKEIVTSRKNWMVLTDTVSPIIPEVIIRAVAESLGSEASHHLVWWERHIFFWDATHDSLNLQKWSTILQHCRHEARLWDRLFSTSIREEAMDRFRRSYTMEEYDRRQAAVDAQPLSDWDLHLYALRLYDDNLYGAKDYTHVPDGPRLYVNPTVWAYQGYEFWTWVLRALSPDRLDGLWEEAGRILEDEELYSTRDLPHPSIFGDLK
jgi:hypothetical protein